MKFEPLAPVGSDTYSWLSPPYDTLMIWPKSFRDLMLFADQLPEELEMGGSAGTFGTLTKLAGFPTSQKYEVQDPDIQSCS